jgi:hypothetical protein
MVDVSDTCRLAIGVFYELHDLQDAMAELVSDGFTTNEICLAGKRETVEGVSASRGSKGRTQLQSLQMPNAGAEEDLVATSGPTLALVLQQSYAAGGDGATPASFWPDLCRSVSGHMRRNGVVLCVRAGDAERQSRSSRILLRHSTQSVQTFEFTPVR